MKKSLTIFLQLVIVGLGIGVLIAMLWDPHLEGRNVHATVFEIYFKDPFLAYVYIASLPFFFAIYQAFKVLGYAGQDNLFSQAAVKALRTIKYCALITAGAIVVADTYLFIAMRGKDDSGGGIMLGLAATFVSIIIASATTVFEQALQNALDIKSENDLLQKRLQQS